ncbi:uncharacterized protein LOC144156589 [Haemaphysalis longicornis]
MSSSDSDDSWSLDDVDIVGVRAAEHFKFDPLASEESDSNEAVQHDDPEAWRLGNTDCSTESRCSREIPRLDVRVPEGEKCITSHQTFRDGCLNIHALEIAYYALMEYRPALLDGMDIHSRYRYTAYRQFVRWIWHVLGAGRRVPLPSCVVNSVKGTFPSEAYTGFKYPEF